VRVAAPGTGEGNVVALPSSGQIIADQRGGGRWMRVTWHDEAGVVVLSLWRETGCIGTVRVDRSQVPALVTALVDGLAGEHGEPMPPRAP
jgi:hypothetical protein